MIITIYREGANNTVASNLISIRTNRRQQFTLRYLETVFQSFDKLLIWREPGVLLFELHRHHLFLEFPRKVTLQRKRKLLAVVDIKLGAGDFREFSSNFKKRDLKFAVADQYKRWC